MPDAPLRPISRLLVAVIGLSVLVGSSASSAPAAGALTAGTAPWPMALRDATHTGTAAVLGPQSPQVLWEDHLVGGISAGAVIGAGGTVYIATLSGTLYALDPSTGGVQWTVSGGAAFPGTTDLSVSPLILPSGDLLWPAPDDQLDEVSPEGQVLWSHRFRGSVLSPVSDGTRTYVVDTSGVMSALDTSGPAPTIRWSRPLGTSSFGSPVIDGSGQVVTSTGRFVVAVTDKGGDGSIAWRHRLDAPVEVSASVDTKGNVFVTDNDATAYSFGDSGRLNWKRKVGSESYSSSSVRGGVLYFGDNHGVLNLVHTSSGTLLRQQKAASNAIWSAQAIDGRGDVYVGTKSKSLVGFDPRGHVLFRISLDASVESYPALTGTGTLVVGDEAGTVYAVG